MDRQETVALFLECEAKRAEVRAAALAEGKHKHEAGGIAHEAAKSHWNDWAEKLLTERKGLEASGVWALENDDSFVAKNAATSAWMERAEANFSRCHFFVRRGEGTKEAAGKDKDKVEARIGPRLPLLP